MWVTLLCLWRSLPQVLAEAGRENRAKNVNTISTESIFLIRCSFRRDVALGEMFVLEGANSLILLPTILFVESGLTRGARLFAAGAVRRLVARLAPQDEKLSLQTPSPTSLRGHIVLSVELSAFRTLGRGRGKVFTINCL